MTLAQWIVAIAVVVGIAKLLMNWQDRKTRQVVPAE